MTGAKPVMAIFHQAKRNLLTGYLHFLVFTSIFLVLTPFYIEQLGDLIYGYWSVVNSFIAYLSTLDFGLGIASTKFTAEALAKNDKIAKSRILSQILFLYALIGITLIGAGSILAFFLPSFFEIPADAWQSAALATFLMALNLVFTLLSKFFAGISFGHQKQEALNLIAVASSLLQGGLSYWFLVNGFGIAGLASAVVIAGISGLILRFLYCTIKFGPLGLSWRFLFRAKWGSLLRFGGGVFIMAIGGQVILNTDNILIGKLLNLRLVTAYSIAYMIIMAFGNIFQRISDVFFPVLTDNFTKSDTTNLRFYFFESTFLSLACYTAAAAGFACFGVDIITIWVGSEQFVGNKTLWVLLLFFWFQTYLHSHGLLLMAAGKIRPIVHLNIVEAITNLFLSVLLMKYVGVFGVALGSLLSIFFTNYIFLPRYSSKILEVARVQLNLKLTSSILLPAIPAVAGGAMLRISLPVAGPFSILGAAFLVSITYLLLLWLTLGSEKRLWYKKKFLNFSSKNDLPPFTGEPLENIDGS